MMQVVAPIRYRQANKQKQRITKSRYLYQTHSHKRIFILSLSKSCLKKISCKYYFLALKMIPHLAKLKIRPAVLYKKRRSKWKALFNSWRFIEIPGLILDYSLRASFLLNLSRIIHLYSSCQVKREYSTKLSTNIQRLG